MYRIKTVLSVYKFFQAAYKYDFLVLVFVDGSQEDHQ